MARTVAIGIQKCDDIINFYSGKKVLLTGNTGFKGTWMNLILNECGANVCGYALPIEQNSFFKIVNPKTELQVEADVSDSKRVQYTVESFKPEIIFHFASYSSLDQSMKIPQYILHTNLVGVLNVLEAARNADSVKAIVVVTSDKCYKNIETPIPYKEDSILDADDPYSVSKVCQEMLTKCYQKTFFQNSDSRIAIATARASNVIGYGDYNISRLLPYLLESYRDGSVPAIRNPYAIRSWQYVLDVLEGYLILGEKLYNSLNDDNDIDGAYNFGPGSDGFVTVQELSDMVGAACLKKGIIKETSIKISNAPDHIKKEANILKLDSKKAFDVLNWYSRTKLEDAINIIVDMLYKEKQGVLIADFAREEVKRYMELLKCTYN